MADSWSRLTITLKDQSQTEILMAWLNVLDADSIVEGEDSIDVYVDSIKSKDFKNALEGIEILNIDSITLEEVENQNWNALWESQFDPIEIDDIYIRAEFHAPANESQRELLIQPKMAFGTGHHETTFMMIEKINTLDLSHKTVLDYGCGTGILSVFAAMQNAAHVYGIDIQPEAVENTVEHFEINNLSEFPYKAEEGDLELLGDAKFDVVLANINRHVLLRRAEDLYDLINQDGLLLISGILLKDEEIIVNTYTKAGFSLKSRQSKGEWCLFVFTNIKD